MTPPPAHPKLYHITHVDNLVSIVADDGLVSDAVVLQRGGPTVGIGMSRIKQRRLRLPIPCHPGDHVGDYVPFYLCPRSIMLFVISCGNNPDLGYQGGQDPIVHLVADLHATVEACDRSGQRWAFTLSNAGAAYAQFRSSITALDEINWAAVEARDFRSAPVKEAKQAEFLVRDRFSWSLVEAIGVRSDSTRRRVEETLAVSGHRPRIELRPDWYF